MNARVFSDHNRMTFIDMKKQSNGRVAYHNVKEKFIVLQENVLNCSRYSKIVLNHT